MDRTDANDFDDCLVIDDVDDWSSISECDRDVSRN